MDGRGEGGATTRVRIWVRSPPLHSVRVMSMITGGHGIGRLAAGHALPLHLLFLLLSYRVLYSCAGKHGRLCALCCCAEVAAARQRPEEGSREDSPFYDTLLLAMRHDGWDMSGSTGISGDAPAHQHTSLLYAIPIFSLLLVYLFRFPLFCLPSRRPCCRNLLLFVIQSFLSFTKNMDGNVTRWRIDTRI